MHRTLFLDDGRNDKAYSGLLNFYKNKYLMAKYDVNSFFFLIFKIIIYFKKPFTLFDFWYSGFVCLTGNLFIMTYYQSFAVTDLLFKMARHVSVKFMLTDLIFFIHVCNIPICIYKLLKF